MRHESFQGGSATDELSINEALWDGLWSDMWEGAELPQIKVHPFIVRMLPALPPAGQLLEIGCGPGTNVLALSTQFDCVGVDVSHTGCLKGLAMARRRGDTVAFSQGAFQNLPIGPSSCDVVLASLCLQFNTWSSAVDSWREIGRVLRAGGVFLFKVRSTYRDIPDDVEFLDDRGVTFRSHYSDEAGMVYHHFTKAELRELSQAGGFRMTELFEERDQREGVPYGRRGWWVGAWTKR